MSASASEVSKLPMPHHFARQVFPAVKSLNCFYKFQEMPAFADLHVLGSSRKTTGIEYYLGWRMGFSWSRDPAYDSTTGYGIDRRGGGLEASTISFFFWLRFAF